MTPSLKESSCYIAEQRKSMLQLYLHNKDDQWMSWAYWDKTGFCRDLKACTK